MFERKMKQTSVGPAENKSLSSMTSRMELISLGVWLTVAS